MKILPDNFYNTLKWICLCVIPNLMVALQALGEFFAWAWVQAVVFVTTVVLAFIGDTLGFSTLRYTANKTEDHSVMSDADYAELEDPNS